MEKVSERGVAEVEKQEDRLDANEVDSRKDFRRDLPEAGGKEWTNRKESERRPFQAVLMFRTKPMSAKRELLRDKPEV